MQKPVARTYATVVAFLLNVLGNLHEERNLKVRFSKRNNFKMMIMMMIKVKTKASLIQKLVIRIRALFENSPEYAESISNSPPTIKSE